MSRRQMFLTVGMLLVLGTAWQSCSRSPEQEREQQEPVERVASETAADEEAAASRARVAYELRRGHANQYNNSGRSAKAERLCRELLAEQPDDAAVWRELGMALMRQGRMQEAEEALNRCLVLDPGNTLACSLLHDCERAAATARMDETDRALTRLREQEASTARSESIEACRRLMATLSDSAYARARLQLAEFQQRGGECCAALSHCRMLVDDTQPAVRERAQAMERALAAQCMTDKVERALAREMALEAAASPRARHARAVRLCREALRHDGNCVEAYRTLAALLAQEGKSSEAAIAQARADRLAEENRVLPARTDLAAAQEAVRLNPRDEEARRRLASLYVQRGEYGAAVQEYRAIRVLLTDPWQREQIDQTIRMVQQRADRTAGR